ncbi:MAG: hypothetical protein QG608_3803 [Actinomycetota bacterium]|nr:hypothetical protein [Actinomycetota bacterium]
MPRTGPAGRLGERDALLVIDETGEVKMGSHAVGVRRQYTGAAGRIENARVAVCLTYTTDCGHTLRDRALHRPRSWDPQTSPPPRAHPAPVPLTTPPPGRRPPLSLPTTNSEREVISNEASLPS